MDMPKPTPAHDRLKSLVGSWSGEEKIYPTPWDPAGGPATATVENRSALDGFTVIQDYTQNRKGAPNYQGHGVFSFSPQENCYVMHWWDTMGMPPGEFKGNFAGDVLTLTAVSPMGHSRATFDLGTPGRYQFRLEVSEDGKQWMPFMEGKYGRAA